MRACPRGVSRLRPAFVRALLAPAAIAAAVALAGCDPNGLTPSGRSLAPLSDRMIATIAEKNMDKDSPILVRLFKEESELEVWKKDRNGDFALLKTYPICRWSGDLGPKKHEGDRQAPEGFYTISPGQMNPNSSYYLAFNTGYPNAYDRAWGYTGSELMVHGDCSSRGCYAMTDEQIQEIYALARESFFGGQKNFQFEAFPFRMTALNMAKHRNNPNFAFWKMLKEGYDNFEATRQEPKVAFCEKRYVFDAVAPENASKPLTFDARGKCPVYRLDPTIADAALDYRRKEQVQMANYIASNVATVPMRTGLDGGTNPVFLSKISTQTDDGRVYHVTSAGMDAPGALPRTSGPPAKPPAVGAPTAEPTGTVVASVPVPTPAPLPKEGEAPPQEQEQPSTIGGLLGNLFASAPPEAKPVEAAPAFVAAPVKEAKSKPVRTARAPVPQPKAEPKQKLVAHNAAPVPLPQAKAPTADKAPAADKAQPQVRTAYAPQPEPPKSTLPGAQPVVPAGSFDARWSALR